MSLPLQAMTSDDDKEITECLDLVLQASRRGLVHESINVNRIQDYTRKYFPISRLHFIPRLLTVFRELVRLYVSVC